MRAYYFACARPAVVVALGRAQVNKRSRAGTRVALSEIVREGDTGDDEEDEDGGDGEGEGEGDDDDDYMSEYSEDEEEEGEGEGEEQEEEDPKDDKKTK